MVLVNIVPTVVLLVLDQILLVLAAPLAKYYTMAAVMINAHS
jgi:hypothetical protein